MIRRGVFCAFLLICIASGVFAADADTEAGRRAEIREEWITAVKAYEKALAAAPEDAIRQRRLAIAKKRGARLWAAEAEAQSDAGEWRAAARAVAAFRILSPASKRLDRVAKRVTAKGASIPTLGAELAPAPDAFPRRSFQGRVAAMSRLGSVGCRANAKIESLLSFLVLSQEEKGTWDLGKYGGRKVYSVGLDGLALLALAGEGTAGLTGSRGRAMARTAERLKKAQDPEGCFGPRTDGHFIYVHAVAARALAEYALVAGKVAELKPVLAKAEKFLVKAQSPSGGWRYGVRPPDSDSSVTYWCVSALKSLRDAGHPVGDGVWLAAHRFARSVTDPKTGRGGYTMAGTGPARPMGVMEKFPSDRTESLSGAAMVIRDSTIRSCPLLGAAATPDEALTMKLIRECLPDGVIPDMYYWHLGAEAFTRMHGTVPVVWYENCLNSIAANQWTDGSVGANDAWGQDGGRIYSTAMCALALMAPFAEFQPLPAVRRDRTSVTLLVRPGGGPTGIYLDAGQQVKVEPEGMVRPFAGEGTCGPDGLKKAPKGRKRLARSGPYGCLLGRIGPEGKPFALKKEMKLKARECGQLYLLVNEADPSRGGGAFTVVIRSMGD